MKKINEIKYYKKLLTLFLISSMTLSYTGCNKTQQPTTKLQTQTTQKQIAGPTEATQESNETMDKIIEEYKTNVDNSVTLNDFKVDEYKNPINVWSYIDNNGNNQYIYNYNLNGFNGNYNYVECDNDTMYVVKVNVHKNNEDWYIPISALLKNNDKIVNVKVTTRDDQGYDHNPLENYIYIEKPTKQDFNNVKDGQQYIDIIKEKSQNDNNKLILSKNN